MRCVVAAACAFLLVSGGAAAQAGIDPVAQSLWGVKNGLGVDDYWIGGRPWFAAKVSGAGARVALVGSGIDTTHPDLDGKLACGWCWRDFVDRKAAPYDDNGHGTFIASVVAGEGHVQLNPFKYYWMTGARGMAPRASLLVAKAVDASGAASDALVADAVRWAMDPNGDGDPAEAAHIIHLAIGFTLDGRDASLTEVAVAEAITRGIIVVAPAGDDDADAPRAPASVPGVVTVAGLGKDGTVLDGSNRGEGIDLHAPGAVVGAFPKGLDDQDFSRDGYAGYAGSSVASAVVAGALALLVDAVPQLAAPAGGPERATYAQALLVATARTPEAGVRTLDVEAMLAAADRGTTGLYPMFFLALALVAALMGHATWLVVRRIGARGGRAEDDVRPP